MPRISVGENAVSFEGRAEDGTLPRAEVTVITAGKAFLATVGRLGEDQERLLAYEAHMPEKWAPAAGFDSLSPLKVRPGKEAELEIEIVGPVARPVLTIGNVKCAFAVDVAENEKLVMKDGENWLVRGPCGAVRLKGRCEKALPAFRGVNAVSMSSSDPGGASAQLRIIKRMDGRRAASTVPVVTLTFDDNLKGHYTIAAPVLERYGFRGTFNIVSDWVGGDGRKMNWDEVRELRRRGHEIASHTASHKNLPALYAESGEAAVMRELAVSRDVIRRETGAAPRFFCHPFGQASSDVDSAVRSAGMTPMLLCRHNFGTGTTPETFAGFLDGLIAGKTEKADILFHGITKETGGWKPLASSADFEGCIAVLAEYARKGRIRVVDYATFSGQGRGTLCLTFDDRSFDNWLAAIPLFREYGARASFFANGKLDGRALDALKRLYDAGHTVGPHTMHHLNAPDVVKRDGFDAYWEKEIAPQMEAFASVGIVPRAMAYPNNRRDDASDAGFVKRGIVRLRAGVRGARPYDPRGLKKTKIVPFPKLDAMYFDREYVRTNALMSAVGIGSAYRTDIDDLCAGLRRAAARGETVVFFSHDIAENPNVISMRIDWLKKILSTARAEGMDILGFDDLQFSAAPPMRTGR
jgi:peptidoglycan/xylan/chitin deacetylase (PgdA/CDA1 family)